MCGCGCACTTSSRTEKVARSSGQESKTSTEDRQTAQLKPDYNKVISGFQALRQEGVPVIGLMRSKRRRRKLERKNKNGRNESKDLNTMLKQRFKEQKNVFPRTIRLQK
ncbi:hypothetical protein PoB_004537000 [Plakobranchus ocellatus]|uniref:Uncharacterized protein n=1 Tax=Plakobranchus ocellatus TaxID=259542 RepID=A0AAV4BE52_9GAST|nr:hypothetical protein PoB_004537000 [Plakobranchus ocellatus]